MRDWITKLAGVVFRSRLIARIVTGVRLNTLPRGDYYFDVTTTVLARTVRPFVGRETRVLDLGTGPCGVIGLMLWKKTRCSVVACDINPDLVHLATENVAKNNAPIPVVRSDFFSNVTGKFDIIVFNAPYVPSQTGENRRLLETRRSQWDGGQDGTQVVRTFLEEFARLPYDARAFVGINAMHAPRDLMLSHIGTMDRVVLEGVSSPVLLPVDVYVFSNRQAIRRRPG